MFVDLIYFLLFLGYGEGSSQSSYSNYYYFVSSGGLFIIFEDYFESKLLIFWSIYFNYFWSWDSFSDELPLLLVSKLASN